MRRIVTAAATLALFAQAGAAGAQTTKAKPKAPAAAARAPARTPAVPSRAELEQANDVLSLFVSAFNSKDVPSETKAGLLICLYSNPLGGIARSHARAMASDKAIDAKSPVQRLLVLSVLCKAPLPAAEPAKGPAGPTDQPKDR